MNIFTGIKVVDLTRVFSGPFATLHFANFGAEVIKIEPPTGDDSRAFAPVMNDWSGYFELLNHNKQSLFLNLKNENDLRKFYELCESADVVVENFTVDVKKKLKIDYDTIRNLNSQIIYASISGVSQNINTKYYDVIAQSESGFVSLNGDKDDMKVATSVVDAFAGMKLAFAISTALYSRLKTHRGLQLNVSMKGSAFDLLEQNLIEASISKKNPSKVGNMDSAIAPFGIFKTKDGAIALAIGNQNQWTIFCDFIKTINPDFPVELFLDNQLRIQNLSELKNEIEKIFTSYESGDLLVKLKAINIPCGGVKKMLDVLNDVENYEQDLLQKINLPNIGEIVVPTGGIFFDGYKNEKYESAPKYQLQTPCGSDML